VTYYFFYKTQPLILTKLVM